MKRTLLFILFIVSVILFSICSIFVSNNWLYSYGYLAGTVNLCLLQLAYDSSKNY